MPQRSCPTFQVQGHVCTFPRTFIPAGPGRVPSSCDESGDVTSLAHCVGGEARTLAGKLTTESIFEAAGNGGQEIRTWFAAAGALEDARMELLSYEPIDELITGMGVIASS